MLIYDNEYETKENKHWTKDKIELQQKQGTSYKPAHLVEHSAEIYRARPDDS